MPKTKLAARPSRKRIAILGGGLGGLSAAFELTSRPGWYEDHAITLYQRGWRLGGKGASGRGANGRIEEHGLHCFWGFYDNAFGMLGDCYREIARTTGPMRTLDDAFKKLSSVWFIDRVGTTWCRYEMHFPENSQHPGDQAGLTTLPIEELVHRYIRGVRDVLAEHIDVRAPFERAVGGDLDQKLTWLASASKNASLSALDSSERSAARQLLDKLTGSAALAKVLSNPEKDYRRYVLASAAQFAFVALRGLIAEGIPRSLEAFDEKFDHDDLRAWLGKHGGRAALLESPIVRGLYNASFCYPGGDFDRPNLAAGVALRTVLLMGFTYKGAFMWKMQASMGDIVFAPIYEALVLRAAAARDAGYPDSMTFEFFHNVKKLSLPSSGPSAGKPIIDTIEIERQAIVDKGPYRPLIDVRGLPCWPSLPLYEQLRNGDALEPFDLESDWCSAEPAGPPRILRRGAAGPNGFDHVVLAIPVAALPSICGELVDRSSDWREMVRGIETIRTKSFQVWLAPSAEQKAWQSAHRIMTDVYKDDFNSVADMSQTLPFEDWSVSQRPGSVVYFSTAMADDAMQPSQPRDAYPREQDALVRSQASAWISQWQEGIFGWLGPIPAPNAFLDGYYRANISADQRYTLSVAGSAKRRLAPDASGFANLFLAGDWTKSPLNLGCAEGATMSGLAAGRAVSSALAAPEQPKRQKAASQESGARFVEYPGMPVYAPTYLQQKIVLCQFVLKANPTVLQDALDRYLGGSATTDRFRALGSWVILQTGHIAQNSSEGPGKEFGSADETSAAFLIPAVRWRGWGEPGASPIEVGMFAPFLFVDHPLSLIAGREVLGMAKHLASFDPPGGPTSLDDLTMETMVVTKKLGASSPIEPRQLLAINRPRKGPQSKKSKSAAARPRGIELATVSKMAIDALVGSTPATQRGPIRALLRSLLDEREVRFFSLRQLRDGADPTRAAFQEVTRGLMRLGKVDLQVLPKGHTIQLAKYESHPIAQCLGLAGGPLRPVVALRARIDEATLVRER